MKRSFRRDKSGQVIIVSALLISVLLLSTALYVIEVGKQTPTVESNQNAVFSDYRQAVTNTVISGLANVSGGGNPDVLGMDLSELKTVVLSNSYQAMVTMDYTPLNQNSYTNGFHISWGANGQGISSACVSVALSSSSPSAASNLGYTVNVSSTVNLGGSWHEIDNGTKQVNLTFSVQNEGKAALTQNFTVSYQDGADWTKVNSPATTDFGNGTCAVAFDVELQQSDPMIVSLLCQDQRGIFVGANFTCTNT
jgi:hypothetical protein